MSTQAFIALAAQGRARGQGLGEIHDPRPRAMLRGSTAVPGESAILDDAESVRLGAWHLSPHPAAASSSACQKVTVNQHPNLLLSNKILDLIQQNDGKLTWIDIVAAIEISSAGNRYECLDSIRLLEEAGGIRSEASDGVIRFWIMKNM